MTTDVFIDSRFDHFYRQHPLVLADAGARGGLKKNWRGARAHLRVLGFEPEQREHQRLVEQAGKQGTADTFFGVALHNRPGRLSLHVARDPGLTSIFAPNRAFLDAFPDAARFDTVGHQEIEADTLDHLLAVHGITDVDFMKVDTQGSELFVLRGAAQALAASVIGVEVEVEFAPIYQGQPLFSDVDRFMQECGYQLFDLRPCYWKRAAGPGAGGPYGQIIWADALYLRARSSFPAMLASRTEAARKAKVLKALSIALLYGYADYALEIARDADAHFDAAERRLIESRLDPSGPRSARGQALPGQRRVASGLRRLSKMTQEPYQGWSVSDSELGNLD